MISVMREFESIRRALDTMLILAARILCAMYLHVRGVVMNVRLVLFQTVRVIVSLANISKMESAIWDNDSIKVHQLISVVSFSVVIWVTALVHVGTIWDMRGLMI
jgi:hypothetical protein